MLDPLILEFIPERIPSDFGKDIFPKILALGKPIFAYCLTPSESLWWIDTPADLEDVQKQFPKTGLALN
jgi:NDP-sugar pyrophosphorylase family protein